MSIQGMRRRFAVHLRYVLYVIIGVFIIGLPFVFTPGLRPHGPEQEAEVGAQDIVAVVNGQPLPRSRVDRRFDQMMGQIVPIYASIGQTVGLDQIGRFWLQAFDQAVLDQLLLAQAAADKIAVSGREVTQQAEKIADQQLEQLRARYKGDQLGEALGRIVAQTEGKQAARSMSEGAFRKWMVNRLLKQDSDQLKEELTVGTLQRKVVGTATPSEQDLLTSYDRVRYTQLVVLLHPKGGTTRTDEQARKRIEDLLAKLKQGTSFDSLVQTESDGPRKQPAGGQPWTAMTAFPPELQKVIAALKPDEISKPFKAAAGYYVYRLDERKRELPKDFEKSKQQLLASLAQRQQQQVWQEYTGKLGAQAKVEIKAPEVLAYRDMQQGKEKEAAAELGKAAAEAGRPRGVLGAAIYYDLAKLQAAGNQWKEAADNYSAAVDAVSQDQKLALPDARAEALLGLGQATEHAGKPEEALSWYQEASNWSDTPTVHQELVSVYQRLGKTDLVKKEQEWLTDYQKAQAEKQKAMAEQRAAEAAKQQPATQPAGKPATQPAGKPTAPPAGKPAAPQAPPQGPASAPPQAPPKSR